MDTATVRDWATSNGTNVEKGADHKLSLTSKLIRFRWNNSPAVAVGSDADAKTRINSVLDGIAWSLERYPRDGMLHLIVGTPGHDSPTDSQREQLGAIGTLIASLASGPHVHLWQIDLSGKLRELEARAATFTNDKPKAWVKMLLTAREADPGGLAGMLVEAIDHPAAALYPKLSSQTTKEPWQIRIDGLDIGRVGTTTGTLRLATTKLAAPGKPREQWLKIVGQASQPFNAQSLAEMVKTTRRLIETFASGHASGNVLDHGQPEHALEAHVLSGRLQLATGTGPLRLAIPNTDGVLRAAQFPTLWGDVTRPARYLDALLADEAGRPWAIELKDQDAGGGHGAYLRAGIGQAVLYRHYIRSVEELRTWFRHHRLDHVKCEAALAFPTASPAAAATIARHVELADRYGVQVLQFPRPGSQQEGIELT